MSLPAIGVPNKSMRIVCLSANEIEQKELLPLGLSLLKIITTRDKYITFFNVYIYIYLTTCNIYMEYHFFARDKD